jgi:hypothetical protein
LDELVLAIMHNEDEDVIEEPLEKIYNLCMTRGTENPLRRRRMIYFFQLGGHLNVVRVVVQKHLECAEIQNSGARVLQRGCMFCH